MCLIFTILFAFAFGYFIRPKLPAVTVYLAVYAIVFNIQTLNLLMDWMSGSDEAFGAPPEKFPASYDPWDVIMYGVVNGLIAVVGVGLVFLGAGTAAKRAAKKNSVLVG